MDSLLDPGLLQGLTEEERQAAVATAIAARKAEARAEQRALERAMEAKRRQRQQEKAAELEKQAAANAVSATKIASGAPRLTFVSKKKRQGAASATEGLETTHEKHGSPDNHNVQHNPPAAATAAAVPSAATAKKSNNRSKPETKQDETEHRRPAEWTQSEYTTVQQTYLGKTATEAPPKKRKNKQKTPFKFQWDDTEDTFGQEDFLYPQKIGPRRGANHNVSKRTKTDAVTTVQSVQDKPLERMTARDWRILRENYGIVIKGGKAPPPLRSFQESSIHPALLEAITSVLKFKEPSPVQRQAIPIGLQRRDLIGIAETGSGKTVAFGVPLCHYLLNLPKEVLRSVVSDGPLALITAPTRELALQIHVELEKLLSRQSDVHVCAIVGGQSIQQQAQVLRKGVHIVVGTPGRLNECIEMAYLVLNQCCYIVMDEADRMIDMGFAPQMQSILDAMGGSIKSETEAEAYQQEQADLEKGGLARHRVTAMFSATMPPEVEKLAKEYLRHPAIVSIGGDQQDTGKNSRITQRILFVPSLAQKEKALRDLLLDPRFTREKVIVFCNEKKLVLGCVAVNVYFGWHVWLIHFLLCLSTDTPTRWVV